MELTKEIKNIAIYLRKSRDSEDEEDTDVLQKHRQRLIRKAEKENWKYVVYEEIESGAKIADRPQMQQLMLDILSKKFDGVLVVAPDRLGRGEMEEQGRILKLFEKTNTYILTEDRVYDTNNSSDIIALQFFSMFANIEYRFIVDRLMAGKKEGARSGMWTNGKPPYGYFYDIGERDPKNRVKVNPEQAKVYRTIVEMYLTGKSISKIKDYLNVHQVLTPSGIVPLENGKNQGWSTTAVNRILNDEFYTGMVVANKSQGNGHRGKGTSIRLDKRNWLRIKGHHQALITIEEYQKILERLAENRKLPSTVKMRKHLLTGILYCSKCNHRMTFKQKAHEKYERALCVYNYVDGTKCPQRSVVLTDKILDGIFEMVTQVDSSYLLQIEQKKIQINKHKEEIVNLENELKKLDKALDIINATHEAGGYSVPEFIDRKNKNKQKRDIINEEIEQLKKIIINVGTENKDEYLVKVDKIKKTWRSGKATVEEKNYLLNSIVKKIDYSRDAEGNPFFEIEYR